MFKKFLFYVLLPGVILGVVYTSGVSHGKRSLNGRSSPSSEVLPAVQAPPLPTKCPANQQQTEQETVEQLLQKHNASLASKRPTIAKPTLAPVDESDSSVNKTLRPEASRFVTADEFCEQALTNLSVNEQPLSPLKPMKQSVTKMNETEQQASGTVSVPNPASAIDCDCGVVH